MLDQHHDYFPYNLPFLLQPFLSYLDNNDFVIFLQLFRHFYNLFHKMDILIFSFLLQHIKILFQRLVFFIKIKFSVDISMSVYLPYEINIWFILYFVEL